jgi:hypothetical protein
MRSEQFQMTALFLLMTKHRENRSHQTQVLLCLCLPLAYCNLNRGPSLGSEY